MILVFLHFIVVLTVVEAAQLFLADLGFSSLLDLPQALFVRKNKNRVVNVASWLGKNFAVFDSVQDSLSFGYKKLVARYGHLLNLHNHYLSAVGVDLERTQLGGRIVAVNLKDGRIFTFIQVKPTLRLCLQAVELIRLCLEVDMVVHIHLLFLFISDKSFYL
jgi:hypothetical protein